MSEVAQILLLVISVVGGITSLILAIIKHKKIFITVGCGFLMLVGLITIVGYLADAPVIYTYPKGKTSVSLLTGICFLITGTLMMMLTNEIEFKNKK